MKDDNSPMNEKYKPILQTESHEEKVLNVSTLPEKNDNNDSSIDTSIIDEQWQEITQDWQSQPVEKTDINALLKRTRRRSLWAKSCLVLNIIATLGLLAGFVLGVLNGNFGTPWSIYLGLGGTMSLVFVYYEVKIRWQVWRQLNDSPDQAIVNAINACESSIKYMVLSKWSCLPFGLLGNWFVYSISQQAHKSSLGAFIFINVFIVVVYVFADIIHRKRKKEHAELTRLVKKL